MECGDAVDWLCPDSCPIGSAGPQNGVVASAFTNFLRNMLITAASIPFRKDETPTSARPGRAATREHGQTHQILRLEAPDRRPSVIGIDAHAPFREKVHVLYENGAGPAKKIKIGCRSNRLALGVNSEGGRNPSQGTPILLSPVT